MLSALIAWILSGTCQTDTAWIERDRADPERWIAVCGDENGREVSRPARCESGTTPWSDQC